MQLFCDLQTLRVVVFEGIRAIDGYGNFGYVHKSFGMLSLFLFFGTVYRCAASVKTNALE